MYELPTSTVLSGCDVSDHHFENPSPVRFSHLVAARVLGLLGADAGRL
jgi:hypothetical protein